jgi:hydroxymethylbilane synthase
VTIRIATRGSALALWQAEHVASRLRDLDPELEAELVIVDTVADRRLDVPLWELGGKGLFVKEVQAAVLDGRADLAVHSGKDLPSVTPEALLLAAVPERGDPRDALVGSTLTGLAPGSVVATGSVRRRAQLAWRRPDLRFVGLRGNMHTRLARLDLRGESQDPPVDAIVAAVAALERLGLADRITEAFDPADVLPQVAQGALAIECRADTRASAGAGVSGSADAALRGLLADLDHAPTRRAVDAERAFLAELGGDCDLPAGCHAVGRADGSLVVEGLVASLDGHTVLRHRVIVEPGAPGVAAGREVARHLLDHGGSALLDR